MISLMHSEVPANIAVQFPPRSLVMDVMAASVCTLKRGTLLSRAAWTVASVIPQFVTQTYRWGPPASGRHAVGRFPFYWFYAAEDIHTAIWEGRFCEKSERYPGFFKFNKGAGDGLLVSLQLEADLKLFEIGGQTAARLGIYDQLSDPDHRWCKYFGLEMHHVMSALFDETGAIGIRYPSRRLRNHSAIAIHSSHLARWKESVTIEAARFVDLPVYSELFNDPCRLTEVA